MLTTQLKVAVVLITLFLAISMVAKAIGSLQPINPALRGFIEGCEDKPQPCWYGIVPTVTTLEDAIRNLETANFTVLRQDDKFTGITFLQGTQETTNCSIENFQPATESVLTIRFNCPLRLGEFILFSGVPTVMTACGYTLIFDNSIQLLVDEQYQSTQRALSPFTAIGSTLITLKSNNPPTKWMGYAPLWKYSRMDTYFDRRCTH
jgi:hypothetical protein